MVRDGARAPPHQEDRNLFLRPLVEYAPGLAERALQRFGRHRLDARGYADGVLDIGGGPLGVLDEPAAVPLLGARFRHHPHLVHPPPAPQCDDEMTATPSLPTQPSLPPPPTHPSAL